MLQERCRLIYNFLILGCHKDIHFFLRTMSLTKRLFLGLTSVVVGSAITACGGGNQSAGCADCDDQVTVGILHSLSGTMAISESTLVDTEKMAIEEINSAGGVEVGGKKYEIKYIVEDGASDWPTFAEKSKKLIDQDKVPVVFGGWTSASRKAMLPVYESKDAFLYYQIQFYKHHSQSSQTNH